jgi:kynurenine/2-aminoadipate aminotransferase
MEMMLSAGDNVLMDTPSYPGTLAILKPLGVNILTVKSDHNGMIPDSLQEVLSKWSPDESEDPSSSIPKGCERILVEIIEIKDRDRVLPE